MPNQVAENTESSVVVSGKGDNLLLQVTFWGISSRVRRLDRITLLGSKSTMEFALCQWYGGDSWYAIKKISYGNSLRAQVVSRT